MTTPTTARTSVRRWLWVAVPAIAAVAGGAVLVFFLIGNRPPTISDFVASEGPHKIWRFAGRVADPNDDPHGWTVHFDGPLEGYQATVEKDGSFELVVQLDDVPIGASVQTTDSGGLSSSRTQVVIQRARQ